MLQREPVNTTQPAQQQPNRFTLKDCAGTTRIVFLPQAPGPVQTDDLPGASQLEYQGPEGQFTFRGDEVDQQQSRLGLLVTVMLESNAADAGQLDFTLVIPPVNLAGAKAQDFATIAIKAKGLGFVVDRSGAQLTYEVLMLSAIADTVILPF